MPQQGQEGIQNSKLRLSESRSQIYLDYAEREQLKATLVVG